MHYETMLPVPLLEIRVIFPMRKRSQLLSSTDRPSQWLQWNLKANRLQLNFNTQAIKSWLFDCPIQFNVSGSYSFE